MVHFATAVRDHASAPVHTVPEDAPLKRVESLVTELGLSGLPVVDAEGHVVGVITRTDLLRAGRLRSVTRGSRGRVLELPDARVTEYMHAGAMTILPTTTLSEAAAMMVKHRIHRLYVVEHGLPIGVLSTKDLMRVVADARVRTPVAEVMSTSVITVRAGDALSTAVDRMQAAHVSGLVVIEDDWPVGIFSQAEVLAARSAVPGDRVDTWMDPAVVCVPTSLPLFRAATQALATRARRVLAIDGKTVRGVVSGLDFARALS